MIILDTCVLTEQQRSSPIWELLHALRESGTQRVALPEMVLELLAQRQRRYEETLEKARNAYNALWRLQFSESDGSEIWPAVDTVQQHVQLWDALYRRTFEVLPLTLEAAREGLWREAQRRRPAKASGKEGSRDSAIWATVLQEAKRDPGKTVYFVTSNTKDFGPDQALHPELAAEVTEASVSVEYLTDLKRVLAQFAERRPVAHDDPRLQARITAPATAGWLHQFVVATVTSGRFEACVVDLDDEAPFTEWGEFEQGLSSPVVEILSWSDQAEYVAADVSRLAATVRVLAAGFARRLDPWQSEVLVAFTLDVRVVFGAESPTALSVSGSRPVEDAEEPAAMAAAERARLTLRW
ncbi:PIN domain-containing protein [Streptomyces sp. FZ201]|uniref:PIN domain-containing protein n=1 Tax=Streptomyces sp. FZ201 TaxID=3057122 RepID=UPI0021C22EB3|nr:PIN domain-containing protein [Streptomyces sp. FZ201]